MGEGGNPIKWTSWNVAGWVVWGMGIWGSWWGIVWKGLAASDLKTFFLGLFREGGGGATDATTQETKTIATKEPKQHKKWHLRQNYILSSQKKGLKRGRGMGEWRNGPKSRVVGGWNPSKPLTPSRPATSRQKQQNQEKSRENIKKLFH